MTWLTIARGTHIPYICPAYAIHVLYNILYLLNTLNFKEFFFGYALHMHKAQRGQKLSVVRKVLTTLNFLTTPS